LAVVVIARYYVQLWSALRHPGDLLALLGDAVWQTLYCAAIGGASLLAGVTIARLWRVLLRAIGSRATALVLLAAALLLVFCFRGRTAFAASLGTVGLPQVPALGEAVARAVSGLCGAAVVLLAAVTLGRAVVAALRLPDASRDERRVLTVTLGFGAIALCASALAVAGLYRPCAVALMMGAVLVAGTMRSALETRGVLREPAGGAVAVVSVPAPAAPGRMDKAWLAIGFLALSFALVGALAPETEYDALWYHLNFPRLWLQAGRPVDLIQELPSLYPMTWEVLFGAGFALGGTIAAKLLHFSCLLVLAATVVLTCRRYAPSCSPYVAVGLLVTAPTVLWEATSAYNDLALAMFAAMACYSLARFAETGARSWLFAAAIEFGLAASTKHLGLVVLAVAAAVLVWDGWRRSLSWSRMIRVVATLGIIAIALPLPWYVRAWHASGNPFFPELFAVFGGGPSTRWDVTAEQGLAAFKTRFGFGHGARALVRLPWDVTVHSALFGGAFGPLWLILIPGCLAGRRGRRFAAIAAVGSLAYMAVWASPVSSLQLRFLVPAAGAFALLAAAGWHRTISNTAIAPPFMRGLAGVALLALAGLNLPPFMTLHEADRARHGWLTHVMRSAPVAVVTGREPESRYLARRVPSYLVWQYANAHLPADASVLTFTDGDNFYSSRPRVAGNSVLAKPAVWTARTSDDVIVALRRLGIGYILFDRRALPQLESYQLPIAGERIQRACATLYDDGRYRLCRVPSASDPSTPPGSAGSRSLP